MLKGVMMKEENDSGFLGPTGKKIAEYLKNPTVGFHVEPKDYRFYEEFKEIMQKHKVQINTEGGAFMLRETVEDCRVFSPIASKLGLDIISFTTNRKEQIREIIRNLNYDKWPKRIHHIQNEATLDIDTQILQNIEYAVTK